MDLLIIGLILLILMVAITIVLLIRTKSNQGEERHPKGTMMGIGVGIGFGIGMPVGIVLGIAIQNIAIGVALGAGIGIAIGVAIGYALEKKNEEEPAISEKERKFRKLAITIGAISCGLGLILLVIVLIR